MNDTLYIQIDKNVKITSQHVKLSDIAQLFCKNEKVLARSKCLNVYDVPNGKPGRYVVSALDLIDKIQKEISNVEITHIGEPVFILTYETNKNHSKIWQWIKTAFVCVITFFGAGFSIMTFNTDVDTTRLFSNLYEEVTGKVSNGVTELELMYSIGIGIGVIFFFNHFGRRKLAEDPTPMEVQMRMYEDDVDMTVMEKMNRGSEGDS